MNLQEEIRRLRLLLGWKNEHWYTKDMFERSHIIFFLTATSLEAARVSHDGSMIQEEVSFSLDETGLAGALKKASARFGQGARMVLPEEYLYVTRLELDLPKTHLRSALEQKIVSVFPETIGTLAWDYELIGTTEKGVVVELSGVVRDFGEILSQALGEAHYRIEALIPESYALARLVLGNETSLLVHEREAGWISALIMEEHIVTSLWLTETPTESDLKSLITFGTERKQAIPQHVIFSLSKTSAQELPQLSLPQVVLDDPLNPILGAAKVSLGRKDSERMDLPLRGNKSSWFSRLFSHIKKV